MSQVPQVPLSALAGLYSGAAHAPEDARLSLSRSPVVSISRVHSESSTPPVSPPPPPMPIARSILDAYLMEQKQDTPLVSPHAQVSTSTVLRHQAVIGLARPGDLRASCLREEYCEIFPEILLNAKPIDEVRTPYDFWNFVEPIFLPLRPQIFAGVWNDSALNEARHLATQPEYPHYSWMWALEDCIDWQVISLVTHPKRLLESVARPIARLPERSIVSPKPKLQTTSEIHATVRVELADVRESNQALLEALRRMVHLTAKSEVEDLIERRKTLTALVSFASTTYRRLHQEQVLDSIEELFAISDAESVLVYDDGLKIRASVVSPSEARDLLNQRNQLFSTLRDSNFPFSDSAVSQPGPFCHICRDRRAEFSKCGGRIADFFEPSVSEEEGSRKCPRRFCAEYLRLYNWPAPPASGAWTCPVCLKICTCDRCVRNVYLHSCTSFAFGCGSGVASEALPGRQLDLDTLRLLAPGSFFLSTRTATPHKRPRPPAPAVEASKETVDELLTPQPSRVREAERISKLGKALQRTKAAELRKLAQLKTVLKQEETVLEKLQIGDRKIGTEDKLDFDEVLAGWFPKLKDLKNDPDGELTAEYKRKFENLSSAVKLGRLLPEDSDTDEEESLKRERRKIKMRRIERIEGSLAYLKSVNIAPKKAHAMQSLNPQQTGYSSGILGLSHRKIRALRSN